MRRIRVIPTLLLKDGGLVKTERFRAPVYVGDPMNAVKIFNEKEVDELVLLDVSATPGGRAPSPERIAEIASESFMPLAYGGGIRTLRDVAAVLRAGVEKVVVNSAAVESPSLVTEAARVFGSQAVVVSIDVKRTALLRRYRVYTRGGRVNTGLDPVEHARRAEELGAGEILLTSIDREGTFRGYDLELIRRVAAAVGIPVVAGGGARGVEDFLGAVEEGASAVAAGSLFVFHGPHRAVLINFPDPERLREGLFERL